jgi:hypothetical protein
MRAIIRPTLLLGAGLATITMTAFVVVGRTTVDGGPPTDVALPSPTGRAVVAELFTSESCSSCPPADDLLSDLAHSPVVPGIRVLALGEHVDYWNRFGWRDRFSSPVFSHRQREYDRAVFHNAGAFTPQMVIDGRFQEVGSDRAAVIQAVAEAGREPKAAVGVAAWPAGRGHVRVQVQVFPAPGADIRERADVMVAITEDHLTSEVEGGENRGRVLKHSSVVRSLTKLGSLTALNAFSRVTSIPAAPFWATKNIAVVAFVQERASRRIVGAGTTRLGDRRRPLT